LGISDNFDLLLSGDITTRGSWALKAASNYVFRYQCNGELLLGFAQNFFGEHGTKTWEHKEDYRIYWKHNQDSKSHPTTRFNAHVNVISKTYNKFNASSTSDYLSNQFNSSLNFSTNLKGIFFFTGALTYNQNTSSHNIGISLPSLNMSVNQFYPFRKKFKAGKLKWYDNIALRWETQMMNQINTKDSLFTDPQTWKEMQSGMQHSIPLTLPVKMGKFNWNTNATLVEKWYMQRNGQIFVEEMVEDSVISQINSVFQRGFFALHDLNLSTSLTTKIYGIYAYKRGVLQARHVISPDLSFSFQPNLNGNAYGSYYNSITGEEVEYFYFQGATMYSPSASKKMRAITRFTINNSLELKVKSKKDTITGTRKITIFDNLAVSCGYDFAADSLNWKPLTISGRTSLFSFLDINFQLKFDPYIINDKGVNLNQTEAKVNGRAMRFSSSDLNIGLNWRINQDFFKGKKKNEKPANEPPQQIGTVYPESSVGMANMRPDFSNPWNITINYTFNYSVLDNENYYKQEANKKYKSSVIQTINLAADLSITRKWKIDIKTGYNVQERKIIYTEINIYRDLHCWEMKFGWVPFGPRKQWNFQINVKAPALKDLKYEMKQDFRDNF
jgi:hypothetical protein